jgi:hypothetical protein
VLSWPNILITLALLFLISAATYAYWPEHKPESKIGTLANSLLDVSQADSKSPLISHPNDGSKSGSTASNPASTPSTHNDRPQKSSAAIPKSEYSFSKTVIGSDDPPGDDE